jgi:16S rRNA processing protein RimM
VSTEKFIILAKIGKPFGLKGFLKLHTYTQDADSLLEYPTLFLQKKKTWTPCEFEATEWKGAQLFVKFPGMDSPEEANAFTNLLVGVPQSALPSIVGREYYWADLEGLTVVTQENFVLGKVLYLMDSGAGDLMVIKGETEHVVPFVLDEVVLKVDLEKKIIEVNWSLDFQ